MISRNTSARAGAVHSRRLARSAAAGLAVAAGLALAGCGTTGGGASASSAAIVDDTVVAGRVRAALLDDPLTTAHRIDVETYRGVVHLSGFVDDAEAKSRATAVARTVSGVRDVVNELELRVR
jgi:hypothetical protein